VSSCPRRSWSGTRNVTLCPLATHERESLSNAKLCDKPQWNGVVTIRAACTSLHAPFQNNNTTPSTQTSRSQARGSIVVDVIGSCDGVDRYGERQSVRQREREPVSERTKQISDPRRSFYRHSATFPALSITSVLGHLSCYLLPLHYTYPFAHSP
jgi:hypothetical protein